MNDVYVLGGNVFLSYGGRDYHVQGITIYQTNGVAVHAVLRCWVSTQPSNHSDEDKTPALPIFTVTSFFHSPSEELLDLLREVWANLDSASKTIINR